MWKCVVGIGLVFILASCSMPSPQQAGNLDDGFSVGAMPQAQDQDSGASDPRSGLVSQDEQAEQADSVEIYSGPLDGQGMVIFFNGTVLTINDIQPTADAIAIQGNTILAVGDQDAVFAYQDETTRFFDLEGRTLMPGFIDAHSHMITDYEGHGGSILAVQEQILANGITTIADMGGDTTGEIITKLRQMEDDGSLRMRVSMYMVRINNCGEDVGLWYGDFPQSLESGALVQVPGIKIFSDGGSCNVPAMSVDYPGGGTGDLFFTQEELNQLLTEIDAAGYQAAIHALGDRAIEQTLNAIEKVNGGSSNEMRHRIEHNATVRPDMISRYGEVQPVATIFGHFTACLWQGDITKFKYILGEEYRAWDWPYRAMIEENPGVVFAWHGDVPVFPLGAIENLWGLVTRQEIGSEGQVCPPLDWAAAHRLPVETALRLMTINSAYALWRDSEIGSLETGKLADIIILSDNPLTMPPEELINLQVLATLVNGRAEYCASGMESICP
jgi:predicted amidohydrolase YtcJ